MNKKIKNFISNKTVVNGMWLYLLQFFNTVLPLLTLPYITRVLGTTDYGIFSIAINIIGYLQVVVEYGFNLSATRKVVLFSSKKNLSTLFSSVIYAKQVLLGFSFILLIVFVMVSNYSANQNISMFILFLSLVGFSWQQNWLFQGLQQMKFISIVNITARTISVILTFAFVNSSYDLLLYCFFYSISPLISGAISVIIILKKFHLRFEKVSFAIILNELKEGWYVFTTSISSKVFGSIGISFLGFFSSPSNVGIYSAINKIPTVLMMIWSPISQVLYPVSSKKISDSFTSGKKYILKVSSLVLPFFILVGLIIGISAKMSVPILFGLEYGKYYYWLYPLLFWVIISIINNFLGVQILLGSGHDKEYSQCFFIGVFSTVILNIILIYFWQGNGAAIAPLLSEIILMFSLILKINQVEKS